MMHDGNERPAGTESDGRERMLQTRLERARQLFRQHHAGVAPDDAFADRVLARLAHEPARLMGWAAMRLLPATLALVVVLAWFAFQAAPVTGAASTQPAEDDLIGWLLEETEAQP